MPASHACRTVPPRTPRGNRKRLLGIFHVNDRVSGQELVETPSVKGSRLLPSRTRLAALGHPSPSVTTSNLNYFSSLLNARRKATLA
jgi:hypothetical protein